MMPLYLGPFFLMSFPFALFTHNTKNELKFMDNMNFLRIIIFQQKRKYLSEFSSLGCSWFSLERSDADQFSDRLN